MAGLAGAQWAKVISAFHDSTLPLIWDPNNEAYAQCTVYQPWSTKVPGYYGEPIEYSLHYEYHQTWIEFASPEISNGWVFTRYKQYLPNIHGHYYEYFHYEHNGQQYRALPLLMTSPFLATQDFQVTYDRLQGDDWVTVSEIYYGCQYADGTEQ